MKQETTVETKNLALKYLIREPKVKTDKRKGIILLHGVGSNEKDLFGLAEHLPDDFYIISARGPFTLGAERYAWYNVDFSTGKPVYDAKQEEVSREIISTFIGQIKQQYLLDDVYLGGFSQGAIMSYSIGLTQPKSLRGIVALSGRLLPEIQPLVKKSDDLSKLSVFVAHGTQDRTLGIAYAREAKTYLKELGVNLTYTEYENAHQISESVLKDLRDWMTRQDSAQP
ncbi:alpha/beta hydrolase [Dyadobacter psychrotolerans]|uniref:Esterase n=1 Tax=Dyadobacter psychrotolerans TaxID=2541721 RepID=A0A4R5DXS7_9BACT|nr:esterase [Dyadobacter psychrotolerans]TDE16145.1 esterase [Dyadobacter psychrotolerans]